MRIHFTLVSSSLFAFVVLAYHRREHQWSEFLDRIESPTNAASGPVEYSPNWAGGVLDMDNGTFTFVTGTFVVPIVSGKNGAGGFIWAGIDGYRCTDGGLLQAGISFTINDHVASYGAWCEWSPEGTRGFKNLPIAAGQLIRINVTAFSPTSGLATVENLSSGQYGAMELSSTHKLCGQSAEWIVEDFEVNGNLIPFADTGIVTFTNALATGPRGTYTPDGPPLSTSGKKTKF